MKIEDTHNVAMADAKDQHASWDGDNRVLVNNILRITPFVHDDVRKVIRWAYGFDDSPCSFEGLSDGSTVVKDVFLGGIIKEPYGVGHDMIFMLHHLGLADPSGHVWTWWESNRWYRRGMRTMCPAFEARAAVRWFGLTAGSWVVWSYPRDPLSKQMRAMRKLPDDVKKAFLKEMADKAFGRQS